MTIVSPVMYVPWASFHTQSATSCGWGSADPTRRQLLERVQGEGVSLRPAVEVESSAAALALAARGVGDTIISLSLATHLGYTERLHQVSLEPPLHEHFAVITRRGAHLSPATRVLTQMATEHLERLRPCRPLRGGRHGRPGRGR